MKASVGAKTQKNGFLTQRRRMAMGENRQEDLSVQADQKFGRQLKEIIGQYLAGDLTDKHLQGLIEHRNTFDAIEYPELDFAVKVLGENKVVSSNEAAIAWELDPEGKIWPVEVLENLVKIRYSKATLRKAAKENRKGLADWRLIYIHGTSLREQREKRGTDQGKQPCFYKEGIWWLKASEDKWATHKPQAGYYLINCCGQFGNLDWKSQEQEIAKLGKEYERCHETVFSEAILTIYMVYNGERIAEKWYHWGISLASDGDRVFVGDLVAIGLGVSNRWDGFSNQDLRVALAWKFDY